VSFIMLDILFLSWLRCVCWFIYFIKITNKTIWRSLTVLVCRHMSRVSYTFFLCFFFCILNSVIQYTSNRIHMKATRTKWWLRKNKNFISYCCLSKNIINLFYLRLCLLYNFTFDNTIDSFSKNRKIKMSNHRTLSLIIFTDATYSNVYSLTLCLSV